MQSGDPDALAELERDARHEVQVEPRRGGVGADEPERQEEEHPGDPDAPQESTGDEALDRERDERRARVDRGVELREEVLTPHARRDQNRALVEAKQVQEVRELHQEVPEEDTDAEGAEQGVGRDGAIAIDRLAERRAHPLRPILDLDMTGAALRQSAVQHERDETDEEADRLRADEVLGVDERRDRRADESADDLSHEHRPGEERKETPRLF